MKNIKKEEKRFMTQTMFSLVQYCARIVPVGPSAPWMRSELTRTYLPQFSIFLFCDILLEAILLDTQSSLG
jgi:hypothetical protein